MSDLFEENEAFDAARDAAESGEALIVDIEGWEGPLHLLLALARKNKVDLAQISILALAEQYLAFIEEARGRRLDIAAEYLVMASWLAYLKSRLLLPKPRPADDEPEPEQMAAALAFRLVRLDAMRAAGEALFARALKGRDVFDRGAPEGVRAITTPKYDVELYDLLKAYAARREKEAFATYRPEAPKVYGLEEARRRLSTIAHRLGAWTRLDALLPDDEELGEDAPPRASVTASSLLAALEITKDGEAQMRQEETFAPIWMRGTEDEETAS
ncbi:segregation/condensation protein A [Marinicauda salina]|uniref:Segregation and condensation protein A n=1 Tax=Marinicauda salina TaxID=2135793 RepID=A0A2U2BT08_9PROT|nr:ScpA family protein [Marinicauda salina]PWE17144.1 segregation/condensation protein A [Marinicauda salina]